MEILNGLTVLSFEKTIDGFCTTFTNGYKLHTDGGRFESVYITILDENGEEVFADEN